MPIETSESLKSRSYIGLVLSQFLAAFNDQALHFVAIFYAGDMLVRYVEMKHVKEETIVTLVPLCFIAPFFLFSPLAGLLADKFSKRSTIVFWKYAEIGITGLALLGFLAPHAAGWGFGRPETLALVGALLVVASVFMMGTHSAFFIPAKYGIMPEILSTSVLSRGNGLLEGTSFTANILGTAFGGFCYAATKSKLQDTLLPGGGFGRKLVLGHEWVIGASLLVLAVIGTLAARLIARIPAAAPDQPLVWQPWIPLKANFAVLRKSRPLVLATVGIAFFLFMTFFVRQTLIFQGESAKDYHHYQDIHKRDRQMREKAAERAAAQAQKQAAAETTANEDDDTTAAQTGALATTDDFINPADLITDSSQTQREELRIAMLAALLGLGVGIGCATAGMLSGDRIELGLVPVGAVMMMVLTAALAWAIPAGSGHSEWPTRILLVLVGVAAGLYIVPLYTLLQHRAPKESKGSLVAMSNFFNVSGGLVAIGVFSLLTAVFKSMFHFDLTPEQARASPEAMKAFVDQLFLQLQIPRMLFLAASLITLVMLLLLLRARPDFLLRTLSWFRVPGRRRLHAVGLSNVPPNGHIILATNCHGTDQWVQVLSAIDRGSQFVKPRDNSNSRNGEDQFLEAVARRLKVLIVAPDSTNGGDWTQVVESGAKSLEGGNLVGLTLESPVNRPEADTLLADLQSRVPSEILPVYCGAAATGHAVLHRSAWRPIVVVGKPMPFGTTPAQIRAAIKSLGDGAIGHGTAQH
jgi:MFS family permease